MLIILLSSLRKLIDRIEALIARLRAKLGKVKTRKKRLMRIEQKLRSMRALAVKIRDDDYEQGKKEEIVDRFDELKGEVEELEAKTR